ncbi:MAG: DNA polymerase IV, partial [Patescibacteria group bacterium]
MKTILHVDMNSYFATVEQQANPRLRGKPVGIIKAPGRGCVIAASIEAKKYGVKTGMGVWDAQKLCPQIILVPSDMDKYFAVTTGLIKIISDYSPFVEVFSIDEAFIDVTDTIGLYPGGAFEIALDIKSRVKKELGDWLKCSVGISHTKLLAKLGSEMQKPDGLTWLTPENYLTETDGIAVEEVCGIGAARTRYLHNKGLYTLGQARAVKNLLPEVEDLVYLRLNDDLSLIEDLDPAKSVSRTFTTFAALSAKREVLSLVRNLIEEACSKLREMKMVGRTFCLSLSGEESFWARKTVIIPSDDPLII